MSESNSKRTSFFATSQGDLCIVFANTSYWRGSASPTETLQRSEDLLSWAAEAGGIALSIIKGQCKWQIVARKSMLAALLAPVLWSAGDLLAGPRLARVRTCANEDCRQRFLDDSKSGNRRWCMMSACGNRAKARRHYVKHRQAK
jgi:predicted RNA-binding Zn ribbon-like protein